MPPLPEPARAALHHALERAGQRSTRQRELVYAVILSRPDHPSADEVFERARAEMPSISLATVYNCVETLIQCGLVRPVNVERQPSRYCPNLAEHAHFIDRTSGRVFDVRLPQPLLDGLRDVLPQGYRAHTVEISFHGERVQGSPTATPTPPEPTYSTPSATLI